MKLSTTLGSLLVLTTLATVGCQAGGEDIDRETTEQDLTVEANDSVVANEVKSHVRRDPASFFAKFDKDGDGRVLVSELPEGRHREHLVKADLDKDGAITLAEMTAAHEKMGEKMKEMKEAMFAKADKNGDGKLAESEVEAEHWQHIKVADLDGDGLLTKAELESAHASGKLRPPGEHGRHHGPPSAKGLLERFDADKDGKLAVSELPERMRERVQTADKNADGLLEEAELTTHFTEMKARFEAEHPDMAAKFKARHQAE